VDNVDAKASATLNIGANAATTTLNLGTNGGTQAINMGTGSGVKTITIGGGNDDAVTINGNLTVSGTTISVNSSNAVIMDKIITLNKGGAAASGGLVGLEVEEAGTSNVGYLRTNAARDAWVAKAPNGAEVTIGGLLGQDPKQVVLTSSTTWTVPSGITKVKIHGVAGGGGGGGGTRTVQYGGGGGGAGGYFEAVVSVTSGLNLVCTVGAGGALGAGNTSLSAVAGVGSDSIVAISGTTILQAYGGNGGIANGNTIGGLGGTGGSAIFSLTGSYVDSESALVDEGGDGDSAIGVNATPCSGNGGASYFGGGGIAALLTNAPNARAYGSGGGGGRYDYNGGTGAQGVIIISYLQPSGIPATYTVSAPLSLSGTALSVANATTTAPGVVQVGSGLSVSAGVIFNPCILAQGSLILAQSTTSVTINFPSSSTAFLKYRVEYTGYINADIGNASSIKLDLLINNWNNTSQAWLSSGVANSIIESSIWGDRGTNVNAVTNSAINLTNQCLDISGKFEIGVSSLAATSTPGWRRLILSTESFGTCSGLGINRLLNCYQMMTNTTTFNQISPVAFRLITPAIAATYAFNYTIYGVI
jgi:hypothetical protein